jgi:DNA-binding NarL/FixJ family response regulator
VRSALRLLLEEKAGLSVVAEVVSAGELLSRVEATCSNLILLDWELPGLRPDEMLPALHALDPGPVVIALSGRPEARQAALAAGADVFVSKGDPPDRLLAVIEQCRSRSYV